MPEVCGGKEKLDGSDVTNEATTDVENTQIEKTKRKSETAFSGFAMPSSTVRTSKTSKPSQKDDGTRARSKGVGELLRKTTDKAETVSEETFKQPRTRAAEKEKNLPEVVSKVITKRYEYCVIIFYA